MAAHQAAGSCHKGPSGASTRAGRNGLKIVKNAGLVVDRAASTRSNRRETPKDLPTPARFPTIRGRHSECPNHLLPRLCGVMGHFGGRRRNPLCSCDGGCGRCGAGFNQDVFDGMIMKGNQDGANEKTVADVKDSRRDRLKLALRENLKRRKSQARGRGEASASSETDDASLDTASRKP